MGVHQTLAGVMSNRGALTALRVSLTEAERKTELN